MRFRCGGGYGDGRTRTGRDAGDGRVSEVAPAVDADLLTVLVDRFELGDRRITGDVFEQPHRPGDDYAGFGPYRHR
jgi:hypothetical protein